MKRIDLLAKNPATHSFEGHAISKIRKVLHELEIDSQVVYYAYGDFSAYFEGVGDDPPFAILSFEPFPISTPIFEQLGIRHFYWTRGSLATSLHYLQADLAHVGLPDKAYVEWIGNSRCHFWPHTIDPREKTSPGKERPFGVVIFDPLVDVSHLERGWGELFPPPFPALLKESVGIKDRLPFQALMERLPEENHDVSLSDLLFALDEYVKAGQVARSVSTLRASRIDIFGQHVGNNWLKRLPNAASVFLHWSLSYTQHFPVLQKSKVLLRPALSATEGTDRWLLQAIAEGCCPLLPRTSYLEGILPDALLYTSDDERDVKLATLLASEKLRADLLEPLQEDLLPLYSWETRVPVLLEKLGYAH